MRSCRLPCRNATWMLFNPSNTPVRMLSVVNGNNLMQQNLEKFQSKGKSSIGVTSFITQYDEVRQVLEHGQAIPPTQSMRRGSEIHEALERLIEPVPSSADPEELARVSKDAKSLVDFVDKFLALLNQPAREIVLRGNPSGSTTNLRGVADCLYLSNDGIVISETKTTKRLTPSLVRIAYHQALMYHWLFATFLNCKTPFVEYVAKAFMSDSDMEFAHEYLLKKSGELVEAHKELRQHGLAPYVNLHFLKPVRVDGMYEEQVLEAPYDHEVMKQVVKSRVDFFENRRDPFDFKLPEFEETLDHVESKALDPTACTPQELDALMLES